MTGKTWLELTIIYKLIIKVYMLLKEMSPLMPDPVLLSWHLLDS